MQYSQGTVAFIQGSSTVVGTDTAWTSSNAPVGAEIHHQDSPLVPYLIGFVDYANQTLTLSSNYAGPSESGAAYAITNEYTRFANLPELAPGDLNAAAIITRALRTLDLLLSQISAGGIPWYRKAAMYGVAYCQAVGHQQVSTGPAGTVNGAALVVAFGSKRIVDVSFASATDVVTAVGRQGTGSDRLVDEDGNILVDEDGNILTY